jgi:hypothetical protein
MNKAGLETGEVVAYRRGSAFGVLVILLAARVSADVEGTMAALKTEAEECRYYLGLSETLGGVAEEFEALGGKEGPGSGGDHAREWGAWERARIGGVRAFSEVSLAKRVLAATHETLPECVTEGERLVTEARLRGCRRRFGQQASLQEGRCKAPRELRQSGRVHPPRTTPTTLPRTTATTLPN